MYRMTTVFVVSEQLLQQTPFKKVYLHTHISFISIKMHTPFFKCHIHVILLLCAPSTRFKTEQCMVTVHCCITRHSSLVSAELTLYIIWILFLYFSHYVIQTSVTIGITQNKYNSIVQNKSLLSQADCKSRQIMKCFGIHTCILVTVPSNVPLLC